MGSDVGASSGNKAISGDGVRINIKFSNDKKLRMLIRADITVGELKDIIALGIDIPANQQRLIYKGRILKDDQRLRSYGVEDDHAIHLVRGFVPDKSANSTSVAAAAPAGENSMPDILSGVSSVESRGFGGGIPASFFPGLDGSALGGSGALSWSGNGLPDFEQRWQQVFGNPNMINEMTNIPSVQNLLYDPDIIRNIMVNNPQMREVIDRNRELAHFLNDPNTLRRTMEATRNLELMREMMRNTDRANIMMNNPQMREVIDRNRELAHVLNDPNTLRRTMEATRNLELMREMMRNTDRAMSNIESLPEGFFMLRRMYENVQEPPLNATSMTGYNENAPGSNLFAAILGNQTGWQVEDQWTTPLTMSLDGNSGSSVPNANPLPNPWSTNSATRDYQNNNTSGNRAPGVAGLGITGLSGLDAQSSSLTDPATMIQLLQNPAMLQMMNQVINLDPQLRGMVDSNPQVPGALQNSEMLPSQLPSHERLQQSMASLSSLLGSMSQQSPLGTRQTAGGAAVPPELLYANQLSQLQEMGFIDTRENIQALVATSGNVYAAVERLLRNLGP